MPYKKDIQLMIKKNKSIDILLIIVGIIFLINLFFILNIFSNISKIKNENKENFLFENSNNLDKISNKEIKDEKEAQITNENKIKDEKEEIEESTKLNLEDDLESVFNTNLDALNSDYLLENNKILGENKIQSSDYSGYIIEFKEQSIIEKRVQVQESFIDSKDNLKVTINSINSQLEEQKDKIQNEREEVINKIEQELDKSELKIIQKYENVFNGVLLDLNHEEYQKLKNNPNIKAIYPNYKVSSLLGNSVPFIGANNVWKMKDSLSQNITGKGITIAVIDTGIDYTLSDFGGCTQLEFIDKQCDKVIDGYDFVNSDNNPLDDHGHGTHVASIISANGNLKGVAPESKIIAYKSLDENGNGYDSSIISAIERATDPNGDGDFSDHYDIISMSLGRYGSPDDFLSQIVDAAANLGIVVVVAAGNEGPENKTIASPANAINAISVGAIDLYDNVASFSSRGPVIWTNLDGVSKSITKPDIVAPGISICAARYAQYGTISCIDDNHVYLSGTSMATPFVSGAVALIKQNHPDWTPEEIKSALKNTALDINKPIIQQGSGRINVSAAVSIINKPLIAKIEMKEYVVSGNILIPGNIIGELDSYEVYYSSKSQCVGEECKENLLCFGNSQTNILCDNFETFNIDDGEYVLTLIAYLNGKKIASDTAFFKVNNLEIKKIGEKINYFKGSKDEYISAIIKTPDYTQYKIEYYDPLNLVWKEICKGDNKPSANNLLCVSSIDLKLKIDAINPGEGENCGIYNPKEITCMFNMNVKSGKYSFRLSANRNDKWIYDEKFTGAVINELIDNWPMEMGCQPFAPLTFLNLNGNPAIAQSSSSNCGTYNSKNFWYSAETNISLIEGNSNYTNIKKFHNIASNPVSILGDQMIFHGSTLESFNLFGDYLKNWSYTNYSEFPNSPVTIIDNKLYFMRGSGYGSNLNFHLYSYNSEGNLTLGFPVKINNEDGVTIVSIEKQIVEINHLSEKRLGIFFTGKDQNNILKTYFDLYLLNGSLIKRTILSDDKLGAIGYYFSSFISMDSDYDGKSEVIIGLSTSISAYDIKSQIILIDSDGNIISKPYTIKDFTIALIRPIINEEYKDIVFVLRDTMSTTYSGQRVVSMKLNGSIIFDSSVLDYLKLIETVSTGDVTGDGKPEIIVGYRPRWWNADPSGLLIYNNLGILEKEILIPTFGQVDLFNTGDSEFTPILADINKDGKTDIIQQTLYLPLDKSQPWKTHIFIFSLNGSYDENKINYGNFQQNNKRNGCYDCQYYLNISKVDYSIRGLNGNTQILLNVTSQITIGATYKLYYKDNIMSAQWNYLAQVIPSNAEVNFIQDIDIKTISRFYKIEKEIKILN